MWPKKQNKTEPGGRKASMLFLLVTITIIIILVNMATFIQELCFLSFILFHFKAKYFRDWQNRLLDLLLINWGNVSSAPSLKLYTIKSPVTGQSSYVYSVANITILRWHLVCSGKHQRQQRTDVIICLEAQQAADKFTRALRSGLRYVSRFTLLLNYYYY